MIGGGDEIRTIDTVGQPDPRAAGIDAPRVHHTVPDGHRAFLEEAAALALPDSVPDDIRVQWNTACNLLIYSWHAYRFFHIAELQALATLEHGLRAQLHSHDRDRTSLKRLLRRAIALGLVFDADMQAHRRRVEAQRYWAQQVASWPEPFRTAFANTAQTTSPDPQAWVKQLADALPAWRNALAHGSSLLYPQRATRVELCRDILVAVFSRSTTTPTAPARTPAST